MRMSDWSADVCSSDLGAYSAEGQEVSADGDTATVLGAPLGLSADAIAVALLALEQQGYVMRGTFTPEAIAARDTEWCERRRLARIPRYTRDRKRADSQPVPAAAFMSFLFAWQGLVGRDNRERPAAPELVLP